MLENIGEHYIINGKTGLSADYARRKYDERIYEVIRVVNGEPLFLQDHFERFENSAALIGKVLPLSFGTLEQDMERLIEAEDVMNNNVVLIAYYNKNESWYIIYLRKSTYPCIDMYKEGVYCALLGLNRDMPNAKIMRPDYRTAVTAEIRKKKVYEVILVNREGYVSEGSRTNIFFVKGETFYTPPSGMVLKGITRKYVIDIISGLGYGMMEKLITDKEINEYDGAFLTGTSVGVLPVRQIDDNRYDSGSGDEITAVHKKYNSLIKAIIRKC